MAQTTNWWDQNIGDWINDRIADWRDTSRDFSAFDAAQKQLDARQQVLSSYNLPAGYEVNMTQRTWYGSETNISIRSPTMQELTGQQDRQQESGFVQQQAAMNDVLAKNNPESAQDAADKMTQQEIHANEQEAQTVEQDHSRKQEAEQEQAHDYER